MSSVAATLRSILSSNSDLSSERTTAFISLGATLDQLFTKNENVKKRSEQVICMSRTGWLMVFNMPTPSGVIKGNALQALAEKLNCGKPLFDSDRDILATNLLYVNKGGLLCNMNSFVCQGHYDHVMSAPFQRKVAQHNKEAEKERNDSDIAQALKRLLITKMHEQSREDNSRTVPFVLFDNHTLRIRMDKNVNNYATKYLNIFELSV